MSKVSSFVLKEFEISYLPQLRRLREICYGEFDVSDFTKYQKNNPGLVWIISSIDAPKKLLGYLILYQRTIDDAWIYQLGFVPDAPDELIQVLLNKTENIFRERKTPSIKIIVRDHEKRLTNVLIKYGWKSIDSMWIMERNMNITLLPETHSLPPNIKIVEAFPKFHLDGVVHVDRSAFISGHRVPKETLTQQLANSGAFVAINTDDNNSVVAYNYNTIDSHTIGHFIRLATAPDARRLGIASNLLKIALNWFECMEVKKIYLRTIPESAGALLYKKFSFIHTENEATYELTL